jgi:hypothetical protein
MQKSIIIRRFTVGTLFKIVALGCSIFLMSFAVLMGVFASLGAHTLHWNREAVTGVSGLVLSPFLGATLTVIFTLFGWLGFAVSFWIFSKFGRLRVDYICDEASETPAQNV